MFSSVSFKNVSFLLLIPCLTNERSEVIEDLFIMHSSSFALHVYVIIVWMP